MDGSVVDVLHSWRAAMRSSPNHYLIWNPCWTSITHSIHPGFSIIRSSYWCSGQDDWESILECICKILQQHIDPKVQPAADHWYSARRCACHKSRSLMRFFFACSFFGKHLANIEDVLNVLLKNWHSLNKSCAPVGNRAFRLSYSELCSARIDGFLRIAVLFIAARLRFGTCWFAHDLKKRSR